MNVNKALVTFIKVGLTILFLLLICYGAIRLCNVGYEFGYKVFNQESMEEAPGQDIMVQIKEGMSGKEIGQMLEEKGLVEDASLFNLQYRLSAYYKEIKPGVYTLNTSQTPREMFEIMAEGEAETQEETTEAQETTEAVPSEGE